MVALVTPFRDGTIDWKAFGAIIERQIEGGSSALVPCGSTGESATLSHDEHRDVVRYVVEQARGRVPVIAGTGSNATAEAIALTRAAKEAGASGALMISPYYNKPMQPGLIAHYRAVADAVDLPIILYNIPGRTASRIEAETIAVLAEHPNIVGLKEADPSLDHAIDVLHQAGDRIEVYAGDDSVTFSLMALGGVGVISTVANVAPRAVADLTAACLAGDWATGRAIQFRILPLIRACFAETSPAPVKYAVARLGLCGDEMRLPLMPMTDAGRRARLDDALRGLGLLSS
jgi:4-hydroxy-tetrahydrodipicolinate synthase